MAVLLVYLDHMSRTAHFGPLLGTQLRSLRPNQRKHGSTLQRDLVTIAGIVQLEDDSCRTNIPADKFIITPFNSYEGGHHS
jgi:hypothetical protein